jgi:hypothetical protein
VNGPYLLDPGDPLDPDDDELNPEATGFSAQGGELVLAVLKTTPESVIVIGVRSSVGMVTIVNLTPKTPISSIANRNKDSCADTTTVPDRTSTFDRSPKKAKRPCDSTGIRQYT